MVKNKYEHLGGGIHSHSDGKDYKKGDVVTCTEDLVSMFPGKFRKLEVTSAPAVAEAAEKPASKKAAAKEDAAVDARGEDVTAKFPKSEDEGFSVFQRGDLFHVYEGKKTTPLNKKGLAQDDVDSFVAKYLEE